MKEYKVPIQSLIDHIKTASDVDPWAKEMAEKLLKEQEPVKPYFVNTNYEQHWKCGNCDWVIGTQYNFCPKCGRSVKRDE